MDSDSYKYSHPDQYPKEMISMYDYAEARSKNDYTVFFGLQYILKNALSKKVTRDMVQEARTYAEYHGIPFEYNGWMYIAEELDGRLPIRIKAVPEGILIPTGNVLFTVESTDIIVPWVASWVETILMRVWYTSNVATMSHKIKQTLLRYAEETQDNPFVEYQLVNFGSRGSSSSETAMIGGMSHLTQFAGTDNFSSIIGISEYYNKDTSLSTIGHSIPASEHSAVTSWGKEHEFDMVESFIKNNKGNPIMACVADSYDYFNFVDVVTGTERFRSLIDSVEYPIFVIRPDSGNPSEIILKTLDIMEKNDVGFSVNKKGFKVFDKYRLIWGDGINIDAIKIMLDILKDRKYSSENIAFGMGGALMQGNDETSNNRDTQGWAIKCSSITLDHGSPIDNEDGRTSTWEPCLVERDVFKDPITAKNKSSKRGKVTTYYNKETDTYFVDKINKEFESAVDVLETVFENGKIIKEYGLKEIRKNSEKGKM